MGTPERWIAVVTGASSGIGEAIALALAARHGTTLCLVGRRPHALEAVAQAARSRGARTLSYPADLARDADVEQLAARLRQDLFGVDVLVHAAGTIVRGSLEQVCGDALDMQYRTNVRAPWVLTQGLLPLLRPRQGQVVFVNSTAGLAAGASVGAYAATKHALKALADSLREEVNADGMRVLSLFLGRTASAMQAAVHAWEGRPYHPELLIQPADVAAVALQALSLPRSVEVTDIRMRPMAKSY